MKRTIIAVMAVIAMATSCKVGSGLTAIQPKSGNIEIPQKGEIRVWQNIKHSSFNVVLTNPSTTQSCELYYVKSDGNEKWVSPSLLANKSLTVSIPTDGHLFIKNFNPNSLTIKYTINE